MPSFRPTENKPPRLTGIANLFRAMRNLGMFGGPVGHDSLEHFVADDGQEVPVAVIGDGPPVVLVHGLGCWHREWMPVAKRLARSHSVYVWDARGHGQSRPLPGIADHAAAPGGRPVSDCSITSAWAARCWSGIRWAR